MDLFCLLKKTIVKRESWFHFETQLLLIKCFNKPATPVVFKEFKCKIAIIVYLYRPPILVQYRCVPSIDNLRSKLKVFFFFFFFFLLFKINLDLQYRSVTRTFKLIGIIFS